MGLASTIFGALAGTGSLFIGPPLLFIGAFMAWQNLRIRRSWRAAVWPVRGRLAAVAGTAWSADV